MNRPLIFEYVLKFPNGKYYTGRMLPRGWQGEKHEAYAMTGHGAHEKKNSLPFFAECTVEKVV